jgi:hypothetical protein
MSGSGTGVTDMGRTDDVAPGISEAAMAFGRRHAKTMFEGRKGHGGGSCSYRTLRPPEIEALLAAAFDAGARHASVPARETSRGAADGSQSL